MVGASQESDGSLKEDVNLALLCPSGEIQGSEGVSIAVAPGSGEGEGHHWQFVLLL